MDIDYCPENEHKHSLNITHGKINVWPNNLNIENKQTLKPEYLTHLLKLYYYYSASFNCARC